MLSAAFGRFVSSPSSVQPFVSYEASNVVRDLNAGYEESVLFDVKLKVADHELPAHKFILACRSPIFRKMFEDDMKEKRENTVILPDMEVSTAKELLRFIYAGKLVETSVEAAMKLYIAADRFDIPTLKDLGQSLMINELSVQNAGEMAVLADLHSNTLSDGATKKFLKCNLMEVLKKPEWQNLKEMKPVFCIDLLEKVFKLPDDK